MEYLKAVLFDELLTKVLTGNNVILTEEIIPLSQAFHRVCSKAVKSNISVPHFRRAMRDGYAVRAEDTFSATEDDPLEFKLVEEVPAGNVPQVKLGSRECTYVATGSMLPDNADSVVMIEFTDSEDQTVWIQQPVPPNKWVIPVGKDIRESAEIFPAGTFLSAAKLGVLSAIGLKEVAVYTRPRVGLASTGNEILPIGSALEPGKVYDINTVTLEHSLQESGAQVTNYGVILDDPSALGEVLKRALQEQDLFIASGGTSKGKEDYMPRLLSAMEDVPLFIHGVRMKPGKPLIFARKQTNLGEKPIFILPGYPTSCMMTYWFIVERLVRQMGHYPARHFQKRDAILTTRVYSEMGRREFKAVQLSDENNSGVFLATPLPKGSESITTFALADGVFIIDEMRSVVEEGDVVTVYSLP